MTSTTQKPYNPTKRGVSFRMDTEKAEKLAHLATVNSRSQCGIVEILVAKAWLDLQHDATARLNPL